MKQLQVINQQEVLGQDFKVYGDLETPFFLAKDVATWIGYDLSNVSKMVKNVDEDEKVITRTNNTSATFLTEDGLYEVLMQSRKPIAKKFKKEVKRILKEIRNRGVYSNNSQSIEIIDLAYQLIDLGEQILANQTTKHMSQRQVRLVDHVTEYFIPTRSQRRLYSTSEIAEEYGFIGRSGTYQFNVFLHNMRIIYPVKIGKKNQRVWKLYSEHSGKGWKDLTNQHSSQKWTYEGKEAIRLIVEEFMINY